MFLIAAGSKSCGSVVLMILSSIYVFPLLPSVIYEAGPAIVSYDMTTPAIHISSLFPGDFNRMTAQTVIMNIAFRYAAGHC